MIKFIIKHKYLALFIPIITLLILASGVRFLKFSNDYHMFFSDDNPQLIAFDDLQDTYTKSDNILIALRDDSGIFTESNLRAIADITNQAWQLPHSSRVDSIANYQHTVADEDSLQVVDLVDVELDKLEVENIKKIATNEILLKNRLITNKANIAGINITIELPKNEQLATQGQSKVVVFARELREKIRKDYPQFEVYLSGVIMLNNAFPEAGQDDMTSLVPMAFIVVFILLLITIRNVLLILGSLITLFVTIAAAMGSAGYLGMAITPPMTSMPVIILTVAVAGSVHLMMSFVKHMQSGEDKISSLTKAFEHNQRAIIIAAVTTSIGFLGLNFSEVPPFHDLGNIAAIGAILSLFMTLVFLPAWILSLPIDIKKKNTKSSFYMSSFAEFVIVKQKTILILGVASAVGFISLIGNNEINDNFVEYFDERVEMRRDADMVDKLLTGNGLIEYSFDSRKANGISDPDFLKDIDKFVTWMRSQPEVNNIISISDTFKRLNKNLHADNNDFYKLPNEHNLAAQYLLLYEMSLPYGLDLNNQINIDKSKTRVSINLKNLSSNEYIDLENRSREWLKNNTPNILTEGASPTLMFSHIGRRNVESMIYGTGVTLVVISLILMFIFKSVNIGIISLVPNLVPAAMAFGIWSIIDGQITMALAIVASITLGIIVDDTVHFLSKFQEAFKRMGKDAADSIRYAFSHVGSALVVTSIALTAGFLVLADSVFQINAGMGKLTGIIIVVALIMDFLLLPALLLVFNKGKK